MLGRVRIGASACGVIVAAGRVWVSSTAEDTVVSVDPTSLKVLSRAPVGDRPCGLAFGDGSTPSMDWAAAPLRLLVREATSSARSA